MTHLDLTTMPESITAGTTLSYLRPAPTDFDTTWQMKVYIAGEQVVQATAVDEGGSFRVTFSAGKTSTLPQGSYKWTARMSKAGTVHDLEAGTLIVLPDLAQATAGDLQTWAEKTLPIIEAAIANRLPSGLENYQVLGRAVGKIPITELMALRSKVQTEVTMERNLGKATRTHLVSFPAVGGES